MLLLLFACRAFGPWDQGSGGDSDGGAARVSVSPGVLNFGTVSVNSEGERTLSYTLYNLSAGPVTITGHDEPIGSGAFTVDAAPLLKMESGEELKLPVRFHPMEEGKEEADILIRPAEEVLHLVGSGSAPRLELGTTEVPATVVGCTGVARMSLQNTGSEVLELKGASSSAGEFAITGYPATLASGETGYLEMAFSPSASGSLATVVQVESNDPANPLQAAPAEGLGYEGSRITESYRYYPTNPTDILIVAEGEGAEGRESAASSYISTLRKNNVDYQLSALSGVSACPTGAPAFASRSDTALQGSAVFERPFRAGPGIWDHQLLGLAVEALTQSNACLQGFRRPGADLEILVVSDGPTLQFESTDLENLRQIASPGSLRVSALIPNGCGNADPYAEAVTATDGSLADWCATDWNSGLARLAELPTGQQPVRYALTQLPVASTISVAVAGQGYSKWSYDDAANEVLILGTPTLGASVEIRYVAAVSCSL